MIRLAAQQQEQQQVGWQGASDFLIRNERLSARGQRTFDFSLDFLEEGSSGQSWLSSSAAHAGARG